MMNVEVGIGSLDLGFDPTKSDKCHNGVVWCNRLFGTFTLFGTFNLTGSTGHGYCRLFRAALSSSGRCADCLIIWPAISTPEPRKTAVEPGMSKHEKSPFEMITLHVKALEVRVSTLEEIIQSAGLDDDGK